MNYFAWTDALTAPPADTRAATPPPAGAAPQEPVPVDRDLPRESGRRQLHRV